MIPDPDIVAPELSFRVPADGEKNVSTRTAIRAVFSEPVKFGATPPVLSANGAPIPSNASLSSDATAMTIVPSEEVPLPAAMSVDFAGVTDLRGNALIRPPWNWTVPLWLPVGAPLDSGTFKFPSIAAGPGEGANVLSANARDADGLYDLVLHRIGAPTSTWSPTRTLAVMQSMRVDTLVDNDGVLVTAFLSSDNKVRVLRNGEEWPEGSRFASVSNAGFALGLDPDGMLFLAYDMPRGDEGGTDVNVVTLPRGAQNWVPMRLVKTPPEEKSSHLLSLTLDKRGTPYVAYLDASPSELAHVRVWTTSEAWVPLGSPLNGEGEEVKHVSIATDDAANVFALVNFAERVLPRHRVQILRLEGAKWIECGPKIAQEDLDNPAFFARMQNGHVFASLGLDPNFEFLDVTRNGWTRIPPPTLAPEGKRVSGAMGGIDPQGVPFIAWTDFESGRLQLGRLNR
ncbi:Ig-like domain-containing protein [Pendulispora rubella]|uniref:Ig-like domain-containing protein n=1 Tax=Pendulispora rubella TaxID=2741070 RepID=A0ABZ2KZN1_9BACT